ncbi:MAG: A/G-specific adenine glycosylase, partial [Actinomycetota bacterium]|nr:A/G-specific adenine glycosylase [Actinomycetota bacterium]
PWAGTDRQARGRLLALLRDSEAPVPAALLTQTWPEEEQRERALAGLVADGLVTPLSDGRYALPG